MDCPNAILRLSINCLRLFSEMMEVKVKLHLLKLLNLDKKKRFKFLEKTQEKFISLNCKAPVENSEKTSKGLDLESV